MKSRYLMILLVLLPSFSVVAAKTLKYSDSEKEFLELVDLLITFDERKVFKKKLSSHEERARFIETFWARRDPDLSDNVNPFRKEWMARRDYVTTHFNYADYDPQSLSKIDVFMLLGPPAHKTFTTDISLVGIGYRNRYLRYPPELWIYENVGYDYKLNRLKIQFVATSAYGEIVSVTDRLTDNFLRNIKYRFIVNPELEDAPIQVVSSADYQVAAPAPAEAPTDAAVVAPASAAQAAPSEEEEEDEDEDVADPALTMTQAPVTSAPKATELAVATAIKSETALKPVIQYRPEVGNDLGLRAQTSYFKSSNDKRLLLGRIGFPLGAMDYKYEKNQYFAPFQLDYHLFNSEGTAIHGDTIRSEIAIPNKKLLDKRTSWYATEFALVLPPDRYLVKAQLQDLRTGKVSYLEVALEVPPVRDEPQATPLVLMDPNVSANNAKFNIRDRAYNLRLTHDYKLLDQIVPVVELVNIQKDTEISTIEVQAIDRSGKTVKTWDLYEGELTSTNLGSFLVHPTLNTQDLSPGTYTLRVEVALASGNLLVSEAKVVIEE